MRKNAIYNLIRQIANMAFALAVFPYVTRILGASAYGRISFADSIVGYSLLIAALGVPSYAIREGARVRDDKETLTRLSSEVFTINLISLVVSCILVCVSCIFVPKIHGVWKLVLLLNSSTILNVIGRDWINSVFEDFEYLAKRYIVIHIIALILVYACIRSENDEYIYAIITVFAAGSGYLLNIGHTIKNIPIRVARLDSLKKHMKPILLLFCISLAARIYVYSDITVIGFVCNSNAEVGYYSLASKIYMMVKTALIAIITVSVPRLSYYLGLGDIQKFKNTEKSIIEVLIIIVVPAIVGMMTIGKELVLLVGGEEYAPATFSLQFLSIALLFSLFGCFFANGVLVSTRKEKYFMIATVITAIENMILNIVLIRHIGIAGAAVSTVLAEATVCIICFWHAKEYLPKIDLRVLRDTIIGSMMIPIVCIVVRRIGKGYCYTALLSVAISILVYFAALVLLKNQIALSFIHGEKSIRQLFSDKSK